MPTQVDVLRYNKIFNPEALIAAAAITGVPLPVAAAFADKESDGLNIYGHDVGGTFSQPGQNITVTATNFADFYHKVVDLKQKSNGVGPMQITYRGYFPQAKTAGYKLWIPFDNFRFALKMIIKPALDRYAKDSYQLAKVGTLYNAGSLSGGITAYGRDLATKVTIWQKRLQGATAPRSLKVGVDGADVIVLQRGLLVKFPTLSDSIKTSGGADGSFGPGTEAAVKAVQTKLGLTADGVVGPWTRGRLTQYNILP